MAYMKKQQTMGAMAQGLVGQAVKGSRAAVALNQVTTRVNDALGSSALVPALGETWAHVCGVQLMVAWRDGERLATLYKGLQPGEAVFAVTNEGVRSPHEAAVRHQAAAHNHPQQQQQQVAEHADRYVFSSAAAPPTISSAQQSHVEYVPHHGGTAATTSNSNKRPAEHSSSYNYRAAENQPTQQRRY